MIQRIISVKNVGTFRDSKGSGNTELKRLTLIYAENGRGKTTLCAILRSLQSGNPALIMERKTLDSPDPPHVKILVDGKVHKFEDGKWADLNPTIEIFDADFVAQNVYSGDAISHDHKKNLCRIVLGTEGVKLAEAFDEQDALERTASNAIGTARNELQQIVPLGTTIDAFISLPVDPDVVRKIAERKSQIAILSDEQAIRARPTLSPLTLPQPPSNLTEMLTRSIGGIAVDAEDRIKKHIQHHHMSRGGAAWLGEGLQFQTQKGCPFCAQSLDGSPLIGPLRDYFSAAYIAHKSSIETVKHAVDRQLSADMLLPVQRVVETNANHVEFWKKHVELDPPDISFNVQIEPVIRRLRDALAPLVETKLAAPLEVLKHSPESLAAIEDWKKARLIVQAYNTAVAVFNTELDKIKKLSGRTTLAQVQRELGALDAQQRRHTLPVIAMVDSYNAALAAKDAAERMKEKARAALDKYNMDVVSAYSDRVNKLLARFGAQFTLEADLEYVGRTPRIALAIIMRGNRIDPGSETMPTGAPCFRNTLSAGDRNTVALAFFIAQLEARTDIGKFVAVFDDPFTSLDAFRKTWTSASIRSLASTAKQVIVMSHSLEFLGLVTNNYAETFRTLKVDYHNTIDSRIIELDLNDATASITEKDIVKVRSFVHGLDKDANGTVRAIRPLLEEHIRKLAPDHVPEGSGWLGSFLGKIRTATDESPLAQFKPIYEDLDVLNVYTSPYMHDAGKAAPIVETELHTHATAALRLIGRS